MTNPVTKYIQQTILSVCGTEEYNLSLQTIFAITFIQPFSLNNQYYSYTAILLSTIYDHLVIYLNVGCFSKSERNIVSKRINQHE